MSSSLGVLIVLVIGVVAAFALFGNSNNFGLGGETKVEVIENPEKSPTTHTVQAGEGLSQIAEKFYGDRELWTKIAEANSITNADLIEVGTVLLIPDVEGQTVLVKDATVSDEKPNSYTVKKGDYLSRISQNVYGNPSRGNDIYEANKSVIKNPSILEEGMVLTIPE